MRCDTCVYWSERVAMYDHDRGGVVALCLNPDSTHLSDYMADSDGCPLAYGDRRADGAVDDPRSGPADDEDSLPLF